MGFEMAALMPTLASLASGVSSFAAPIMSGIGGALGGTGAASGILGTLGNLTGAGQIASTIPWNIASPAQFGEAAGLSSLSPANAFSSMPISASPSIGQQLMRYTGNKLIDRALTPRQRVPPPQISLPQGGDLSAPVVSFGPPPVGFRQERDNDVFSFGLPMHRY